MILYIEDSEEADAKLSTPAINQRILNLDEKHYTMSNYRNDQF